MSETTAPGGGALENWAKGKYALSKHALFRMRSRNLSPSAVQATMKYGREICTRGAMIFALGRAEVNDGRREGLDLSKYEGIQVVCSLNGSIITVYRNRRFRGLKSGPQCWPVFKKHAKRKKNQTESNDGYLGL